MGDAPKDHRTSGASNVMSVKRKAFRAILPLLLAFVMAVSCFFIPLGEGHFAEIRLKQAASSLSDSVLRGETIENAAMQRVEYVPFIGSSEWRRFNAFHPSILAEKYNRDYRPFLIGTAGTQSLTHFLTLHSLREAAVNKRAVFVISPQWFRRSGVEEAYFEKFFSPVKIYDWLCDEQTSAFSRTYFAQRMLKFEFINKHSFFKQIFEQLADGRSLDRLQLRRCQSRLNLLRREDRFFGWFFAENHLGSIASRLKDLPDIYDANILDRLAFATGKRESDNNAFRIKNSFYNWRIKPKLDTYKGAQTQLSYDKSPEYGDFQLVLNEIARNRMEVLFVIPPVNQRWAEYTGLSKHMYDRFVRKVKLQLRNQGFTRILDLSQRGEIAYFMEDTIHLGWRGWVEMDRSVKSFLKSEAIPTDYRINPYYCSEEWTQAVIGIPNTR
jgi:D-alanine transfer protein